jgi:hypothetical protein
MKVVYWLGGGLLVSLLIAFGATNPSETLYTRYATRQLSLYLKEEACPELSDQVGGFLGSRLLNLEAQCAKLVGTESLQQLIQKTIAENTQRQNWGILSIYTTQLSVDAFVEQLLPVRDLNLDAPTYKFTSVGVLQQFYVYRVKTLK